MPEGRHEAAALPSFTVFWEDASLRVGTAIRPRDTPTAGGDPDGGALIRVGDEGARPRPAPDTPRYLPRQEISFHVH